MHQGSVPTIFSRDLLEDVDLQVPVRHHLLQAAVLLLELAHALDVGRFQAAKVLPPAVDRLAADTVLLRHVRDRFRVGLPEDRDHLFFGESGLLHGSLTFRGRHSLKRQLVRKSPGRSPCCPMVSSISRQWCILGVCHALTWISTMRRARRSMRRYCLTTKREAVNFALRALASEPIGIDEARQLRGSGWDGDIGEMRTSRST